MKVVTSPSDMKNLSLTLQRGGNRIALVPTMGALHDGHMSLLKIAREHGELTVMSIFVNPTQFGPNEDYAKYPRPLEDDRRKAEAAGCDILFAPSAADMYPQPYYTYVNVETITDRLCGASRPGHFRGVSTVVMKLFSIVAPQVAVFGQKDAQQVVVLKRMVHDLNLSVGIVVGSTIRESDGLAMSSRNRYLTERERAGAPVLYRGLCRAAQLFDAGQRSATVLKNEIQSVYAGSNYLQTEYLDIVSTSTLETIETITGTALVAVAARTTESGTRLIDNIALGGTL